MGEAFPDDLWCDTDCIVGDVKPEPFVRVGLDGLFIVGIISCTVFLIFFLSAAGVSVFVSGFDAPLVALEEPNCRIC